MDFFKNWETAFRACNQEDREKSKEHWLKCHAENLASGRHDLIIFSAQILAHIAIVENERSCQIRSSESTRNTTSWRRDGEGWYYL